MLYLHLRYIESKQKPRLATAVEVTRVLEMKSENMRFRTLGKPSESLSLSVFSKSGVHPSHSPGSKKRATQLAASSGIAEADPRSSLHLLGPPRFRILSETGAIYLQLC